MNAQIVTATDLAGMTGKSPRTILRWADEENWPIVNSAEGRMFPLHLLPVERRAMLLREQQADTITPDKNETPTGLSSLKEWQREIMEARLALFREYERLERRVGTNTAIKEFCNQVKFGLLPEHLQKLVAVANARSGKKATISKATIYRWKKFAKSDAGIIAFAPADPSGNDEQPAWVPYFLKCYQRPQKPSMASALEQMIDSLPADITPPSYDQLKRWMKKRSRLEVEKGRHTGSALRKYKGFVRRSTKNMMPMDIGQCDGHSFKARIAHPEHGRPFKPEVCAVLDWKTRVCTGWSAWLSESAMTVSGAILHSLQVNEEKPYGGVYAMLYSDAGAGNLSHMVSNEVTGILARCGTEHHTGRPGNPQGRGLIERSNVGLWINAAKRLETYSGKDMDASSERKVYLLMDREVKKTGTCTAEQLPSWDDFLTICQDAVDRYNRRPHTALPKITDPNTGRKRHMAPLEYWATFIADGWRPTVLPPEVIDDIRRPQISRKAINCEVSLFGNSYYDKALEHYNGEDVIVEYDIHDARMVRVRDQKQRLICKAGFERNVHDAFPVSAIEHNREQRAKRRLALVESKRQEIEDERRGMLEQETDRTMLIEPDEAAVTRVLAAMDEPDQLVVPSNNEPQIMSENRKEAGSYYASSGTLTEMYQLIRAAVIKEKRSLTSDELAVIEEFYDTDNGRLYLQIESDLREV